MHMTGVMTNPINGVLRLWKTFLGALIHLYLLSPRGWGGGRCVSKENLKFELDIDLVFSIVIVQVISTVMHKNLSSTPLIIRRCFSTILLSSSSDFCAVDLIKNFSFTPPPPSSPSTLSPLSFQSSLLPCHACHVRPPVTPVTPVTSVRTKIHSRVPF